MEAVTILVAERLCDCINATECPTKGYLSLFDAASDKAIEHEYLIALILKNEASPSYQTCITHSLCIVKEYENGILYFEATPK